jgi:hypothetical protein
MLRSRLFGHDIRFVAIVSVLVLSTAACGGGSRSSSAPTAPTNAAPAAPATATLGGQVVSLNGGAPISGIAVDANGVTATSDSQGMFSLTIPTGASAERIVLTAPQILSRTVFVARTTRTLKLDVIRTDDGGFDAAYYRKLVRNELGTTTGLQPIRRWTRSPSFYLRTVDEKGITVDPAILDGIEADIRLVVPMFTAAQFDVATIERGTQTRETTSGWITVKVLTETEEQGVCGRASVGLELGGVITLYKTGCGCDGSPIGHGLTRHEIGHSMGLWHTDRRSDVMFPTIGACHAMPSSAERFHASIAYARPVGNVDPDIDPSTTIRVAPQMVEN